MLVQPPYRQPEQGERAKAKGRSLRGQAPPHNRLCVRFLGHCEAKESTDELLLPAVGSRFLIPFLPSPRGEGQDERNALRWPSCGPLDRPARGLAGQGKTGQSRHDLYVAWAGTSAGYRTGLSLGSSSPRYQGRPMTLSLTYGGQPGLSRGL